VPNKFSLKLSLGTEMHSLDPTIETELHRELIPTVKNSLCAKLKTDGKRTINLFKQNLIMEHKEESKRLKPVLESESISKKHTVLSKSFKETNATTVRHPLKRNLPSPFTTNKKHKKIVGKTKKNVDKSKNETNFPIYQKTFVPDQNNDFYINNIYSKKKSSTSSDVKKLF